MMKYLELTFEWVPFIFEMIGVHLAPPFNYSVTELRCPCTDTGTSLSSPGIEGGHLEKKCSEAHLDA
jgi:hypothetical protein